MDDGQVVVLAQYIFVVPFCGCPALPGPPYLGRIALAPATLRMFFFLPPIFLGREECADATFQGW